MYKQFIAKSLVLLCALLLTSAYADSGDKKAKFQVVVQNNSSEKVYYKADSFVQNGTFKINPDSKVIFSMHHHRSDFPYPSSDHFSVFFDGKSHHPLSIHCRKIPFIGHHRLRHKVCCTVKSRGKGINHLYLKPEKREVCGLESLQVKVTAESIF